MQLKVSTPVDPPLEAFHMKCQRQILHIHWSQHVTDADVSTGLPPVVECGLHHKTSLVSTRSIARLTQGTHSSRQRPTLPSRSSIRSFTWSGLETSSWSSSRSLDRSTPQSTTTLDLFLPTSGDRQAIVRGHGGATRRPELAMR